MPAWPASVPLHAEDSSYSEDIEGSVAQDQPEVGAPSGRRRSGISTEVCSFETVMSFTEYDALMVFYSTDLIGGVLHFTRAHPRDPDGASENFQFTEPPLLSSTGPTFGRVSLKMRRLP